MTRSAARSSFLLVRRRNAIPRKIQEFTMLYYAVVFLVIALVAAFFGFGGIAVGAASIAKILFVIFLVLFLVSLLFGYRRR
jgi:uncharacterized membrane protein YtjA (UPF0391 family)